MAGDDHFLSRWSRRKTQVREGLPVEPEAAKAPVAVPASVAAGGPVPTGASRPLPPIESLTPDSDFTAFMQPEVEEGVKRQALRALFRDPQFNVMDGLDIYTGDFSQPDPLPAGWLEKMNQVARLGAYEEKPVEPPADIPETVPEPAIERQQGAIPDPVPDSQIEPPPAAQPSVTPMPVEDHLE